MIRFQVSTVFIEAVKVELRCPFSMKYLGFHSVLGIASFQIHQWVAGRTSGRRIQRKGAKVTRSSWKSLEVEKLLSSSGAIVGGISGIFERCSNALGDEIQLDDLQQPPGVSTF